ncbi:Kinesin-like protein KIF16B [Taenia solium]|eukprot:TsM_000365500 transcript=TsM_000365500 gene=TsM_000365500
MTDLVVALRISPNQDGDGESGILKAHFNTVTVFNTTATHIFKCIGLKAVEECLDGFNCSIFAYGMPGTGKTYTIFGTKNCPGLVPQCCKALFESALHRTSNDTFLEISFFEVYNEHVYDLLAKVAEDEVEKVSLRVREHPRNGPYAENLSKHAISHLDDVLRLIDRGTASRATAETLANPKSSRSHSVFTIHINQNVKSSSGIVALRSKLHLIDLAGSPVSLNHLPMHSARKQKIYVPYRDSKLTWLLRDALGGNSKTAVIITVSPSEICLNETLHSLRFAQQIKMIKNYPISNKTFKGGSIDRLLEEINRLKDEVNGWRKVRKTRLIKA